MLFRSLPFLPAALPVLNMLCLPSELRYLLAGSPQTWQQVLSTTLQGTVLLDAVKVGHNRLGQNGHDASIHAAFQDVLAWRSAGKRRYFWVTSHYPQAAWGLADGVLLSEADLLRCTQRPSVRVCCAQVSTAASLAHAERLGLDGVLLDSRRFAGTIQSGQPKIVVYHTDSTSIGAAALNGQGAAVLARQVP